MRKLPTLFGSFRTAERQLPTRTDRGSGIDKDRPDYTVYTGEWEVGRIFETRGQPENLRWFWSLTINGPMMRSGRVASPEEAKAQLQRSCDAWKAWAKRSIFD